MSKKIIVLGDTTDHGGAVISCACSDTVDGKPIAAVGDIVDCPKHGRNPIVEGDGSFMLDGVPVALEGHKTQCGAVLIGSVGDTVG